MEAVNPVLAVAGIEVRCCWDSVVLPDWRQCFDGCGHKLEGRSQLFSEKTKGETCVSEMKEDRIKIERDGI